MAALSRHSNKGFSVRYHDSYGIMHTNYYANIENAEHKLKEVKVIDKHAVIRKR